MTSQESDFQEKHDVPRLLRNSFAIGEISDVVAYQGFSFLIFTFYYVICGLNVNLVTIVYIIWSIYNAFNDPLFGAISDKTVTRRFGGGRRRPWMVAALIPLAVVMFFLFTPPLGNQIILALYMLLIMSTFDTFYTAFSLNHTSLYPEMFSTDRAREQVGTARRIFMVFGLIIAFALPSVFIGKYTGDPAMTIPQYQITGIVFGVIIAVTLIIHLKWGVNEPFSEKMQPNQAPGFRESFKITLKNKKFVIFVGASTACWYVFTLLPMLMPLYCAYVLKQTDSFMTTVLLLIAFLSTIPGVLIWTKIDARVGSKQGMGYTMIWWGISLLALLFTTNYTIAAILMIPIGMGLGGPTYFIDRNISNVADEDQIATNCRREASYYGVHAVFVRLAAILVILSINLVFTFSGWEDASMIKLSGDQVFGIQMLMSIFPALALAIGLLFLKFYKLGKNEVREVQKILREKNAC
ncbi:MAG TPA: MFS transporter [Candidatus Lokiarchaeia archaeon]|nr:MFS transporter [Candidatus Lokiarchaeia archaeon]